MGVDEPYCSNCFHRHQQSGHYSKHLEPTAPIPASSTAVHHLLEHGGKLCKMSTYGVVSQLIVEPPRIVLNDFMSWVLDVNTMGEQEQKQVITVTKIKQERTIQDRTKIGPFIDFLQYFYLKSLALSFITLL